jgi:hypothetical protein
MANNQSYKKARTFEEIDNAVRFDVPISPDHEFYTDFADVRGDFEDRTIYKVLNVNPETMTFNSEVNQNNKTLLFLAGMRGSGKTSELAKIAKKLHKPDCFFCVVCNIDEGLDVNDMEYMDILIFQIERLFEEIKESGVKLETPIIESLQQWFSQRIEEVNKVIKREGGFEVEVKAGTPTLLSFLGITAKIKANLLGSKENAQKIRTVLKNNFSDFALKINEFIEYVNTMLRRNHTAKEILFIIDGLEKTASLDIRKKIIIEEINRLRQIRTNTIFTLPIELMPETLKLKAFSTVISFPYIKIKEKDDTLVEKAIERFMTFTYKRIDEQLFDSRDTVREAILYGGGSLREYLRVLEYANLFADAGKKVIDRVALNKGVKKLAAQTSQYITQADLENLKVLKEANKNGTPIPYGIQWQDLLENLIVLEYNDGTYKRVNPLVEESELYKYYVR